MAHTFDRYLRQESRLHQLDPRLKVVATLAFVLATLLLPDGAWSAYALSWLCLWLATRLAGLPYRVVFKRSLIILPFLLTALTLLINTPGATVASWTIGPFTVTVSDAGLIRFVSVMVRGWLAVQAAVLLTAVTQFPDLMHALNHLRVPALLVSIISFMYRYLFVLADEAQRLLRARQARSARLPGSWRPRWICLVARAGSRLHGRPALLAQPGSQRPRLSGDARPRVSGPAAHHESPHHDPARLAGRDRRDAVAILLIQLHCTARQLAERGGCLMPITHPETSPSARRPAGKPTHALGA